jgi:sugar lactone lactonase YvrE
MKKNIFASFILLSCFLQIWPLDPQIWSVNTRDLILRGDARGVSIDASGTLSPAPTISETFKTGQSYIWSALADGRGNVYLGTGVDGKVFRVDAAGNGSVFADFEEMNVSALAMASNGDIFAGTMPDGKVYRIDKNGKAEVYFAPKEKYIWSLAAAADGSLIVGTGDGGRVYRVRSANADPGASLMFDSTETNIVSLAVTPQGEIYAGTDPGALVLRFSADGKVFGVLDSPLREINKISISDNGQVYVLALGDSASASRAADPSAATSPVESKPVTVDRPNPATPEQTTKSRYDLSNAKTAVYRIHGDGMSDIIWSSNSITGFSLFADKDHVLMGTSDKGRIYRIEGSGDTLLLQTDAAQITNLIRSSGDLFATSSNQGTLFRFSKDSTSEGTYESPVLDARNVASWGRLWWRSQGDVSIQTRSGNTERPDATWSGWSAPMNDPSGGQIGSFPARYMQWRAVLRSKSGPALLQEVNVAFLPRNIAPEITSLSVLPANVGLAPNPSVQVDPNIELAGLDPLQFGIPSTVVPPRRVYQRGAVSLQWTAEDRNGDKLLYDVLFREVSESSFKTLKSGIDENFFTVDGQSLSDGKYIFKVVARDTPSNPTNIALSGERMTEPIEIDNSPPLVNVLGKPAVTGDTARVTFSAQDASGYIVRGEYSINGGRWIPVYPEDGIADSPKEQFTVEVKLAAGGEHTITLRVWDAAGNAGTARAVIRR